MRGTDRDEYLPVNFGTFTCSCGEGMEGGHSKLEGELIVGDLKKGVKWLVNVLRSAVGEFEKMAVQETITTLSLVNLEIWCLQVGDVAEDAKSGDKPAGLGLDHGLDNEKLDLRLNFEASSSASVDY